MVQNYLNNHSKQILQEQLGYSDTTKPFWKIVRLIDWKGICDKHKHQRKPSPSDIGKKKLKEILGPEYLSPKIRHLHDIAVSYRRVLQDKIRDYSREKFGDPYAFPNNSGRLSVSDDGFWDLAAHIVGCGKEAYMKAATDPATIVDDYGTDNGCGDYTENFEYIF